jgi:membrane-bound metal-dependent hydrolase YbcI (DUF457 family)
MYAINHATTALALKRMFPGTPLLLLLGSVQVVEILWVLLNATGHELVTTEVHVRSVADIHLVHMPWSHSLLTTLVLAVGLGAVVARLSGKLRDGVAIGIGVASHLALDLITHAPDIALAPFVEGNKLGLGLYANALMVAFAVEFLWGLICVALYGGGRWLYAAVALFNVANFTMYTPGIAGPEGAVAGRPMLLVALVGTQIVLTLGVVFFLGRRRERHAPSLVLEQA